MRHAVANQNLTVEVVRVGASREPVLVIDDVLTDAPALVTAAQGADWREVPPGGYPGRRAPLPGAYVRALLRRLDGPIRQRLFAVPMRLDRFECSFSLVTRPPGALGALQRVPHIDIARDSRVAILHYLCGPQFGGTAFFRQTATGLEQIGPADRARYLAARAEGLSHLRDGDAYPGADTPGYAQTGMIAARFNRVIAYRSFTLHSGVIDDTSILSDDPATGRLTANIFADYGPPPPA